MRQGFSSASVRCFININLGQLSRVWPIRAVFQADTKLLFIDFGVKMFKSRSTEIWGTKANSIFTFLSTEISRTRAMQSLKFCQLKWKTRAMKDYSLSISQGHVWLKCCNHCVGYEVSCGRGRQNSQVTIPQVGVCSLHRCTLFSHTLHIPDSPWG